MLKLKSFTANSFMGISADDPMIITLPEGKGVARPITLLKGNQGTKKTSTLMGIAYGLAAAFNIDPKNFINTTDNAIDEELEVEDGDKEEYKILVGTNRVALKKRVGDKYQNMSEPKAMIRKMAGPIGLSPMFLKEKEGKKQIQWFKETFGTDEEASKKELKKIADLKNKVEERKVTNREIKATKGWLDLSPLFQSYEKSQKKFSTPINAEKEKAKFDELSKKKTAYHQYENTLAVTKAELVDLDGSIADMEIRLKLLKEKKVHLSESVVKGEKWIEQNKPVLKEYEAANTAWLNLSKDMTEYSQWKEVLKKEKEYNALLEQNIQENADIEKLRTELLKITKSYLPEIEGLEIYVQTGLDEEREDGIYFQGRTLAQLSESELWDLFMQIWEQKGVQFIFIENINALGSEAIKTLNRLAKLGYNIFASEMDRSKKEIGVSFEKKVE
jgi:hypothetical protein